ncbi:P-loop NTPase fold protein [Vibrio sp. 99-8-1]|uniref:P-loop NTPase fold protein n=1 Tax=Vibrio sp. 99-8-1 TaxID=2607602 RepID=UPI0014935B36|nr:P-loop NTPase fold protein [Vibrio sp. 99-8-1]NOI65113.1 AAA family ATPase [Vibrio sp. 99-8-1]
MERTCQQVKDCLEDRSFASIILLSGPWGSGKTHLARHKLIPELNKISDKKTHYISLFGLSTLDDFRDRVLASTSLGVSSTMSVGAYIKNIVGASSAIAGDSGTTLGAMNALTKPIKHKLLSKVNNRILVVDDLERASSEQLVSEVLGECLNFAENNTNVWVVVIANKDQINNTDLLEKTFLDQVHISPTTTDIINFVSEVHPDLLNEEIKRHFTLVVEQLKLTNLRVVQRILQRYAKIKSLIESQENVDCQAANAVLIDAVARICHAHYEHGFKFDELCGNVESEAREFKKLIEKRKQPSEATKLPQEDERLDLLTSIIKSPRGRIPPAMIKLVLGISDCPENPIEELNLPLKSNPIDRLISLNFETMNEKDFQYDIKELETFVFEGKSKPFYKWFNALDTWIYLIDHDYVYGSSSDAIKKARTVCYQQDFFTRELHSFSRFYSRNFYSTEVSNIQNEVKPILLRSVSLKESNALQEQFVQSWTESSHVIYQKYDTKPFLDSFELDAVIDGIVSNWSRYDTIVFGQYMEARYKISNIYDYLSEEFDVVRQLKEKLEVAHKSLNTSLQKGKITELLGYLDKAVEYVERAKVRQASFND